MQHHEIVQVLQDNDTFLITYYAKKYSKIITRKGTWTSKKGDNCLCYYDVDAPTTNKYRTAVNYEVLA